jgi:hypothetical protein
VNAWAYESSLLALAQVIESKQKSMTNLMKILTGLIDEHNIHIYYGRHYEINGCDATEGKSD